MAIEIEVVREIMQMVIPFNRFLGFELTDLKPGFARMEVPFRDEFIGDPVRPALHGGVISALIDTCGGAACWTEIEPADRVSTVDLRVDYLRPGRKHRLVAEGRVIRIGNHVGVVDLTAFHSDSPSDLIACGKGVYNVRRSEG
ncbi:MAG: hotdog fold thioesterase [Deltaproteobacteria bacterium]|nr:hotdog fold thioesterase [Deltaproteobacteria bacterium]